MTATQHAAREAAIEKLMLTHNNIPTSRPGLMGLACSLVMAAAALWTIAGLLFVLFPARMSDEQYYYDPTMQVTPMANAEQRGFMVGLVMVVTGILAIVFAMMAMRGRQVALWPLLFTGLVSIGLLLFLVLAKGEAAAGEPRISWYGHLFHFGRNWSWAVVIPQIMFVLGTLAMMFSGRVRLWYRAMRLGIASV